MRKYLKPLKIFLMASVLSGCSGLPIFPDWNPFSIIQSKDKAFKCKLVDSENLLFECDKIPVKLSSLPDGMFCTTPEEQKNIINWAKEVKRKYENLNKVSN